MNEVGKLGSKFRVVGPKGLKLGEELSLGYCGVIDGVDHGRMAGGDDAGAVDGEWDAGVWRPRRGDARGGPSHIHGFCGGAVQRRVMVGEVRGRQSRVSG